MKARKANLSTMMLSSLRGSLIACVTIFVALQPNTQLFAAEAEHPAAAPNATTTTETPTERFKPERLWLPSSAQHLRPYLQLAVEQALLDDECVEVMYARLNEYRTVYDEPTFSVLCKKDYKTTFNRIYRVSELDEFYDSRVAASEEAASNSMELSEDIRNLRESLLIPSDAIVNNALPAAVQQEAAPSIPAASQNQGNTVREEDPNDLSLDLSLDLDAYRQ